MDDDSTSRLGTAPPGDVVPLELDVDEVVLVGAPALRVSDPVRPGTPRSAIPGNSPVCGYAGERRAPARSEPGAREGSPAARASLSVPLTSGRERLSLSLFTAAWILAAVSFWTWWLDGHHVTSVGGMVLNSSLIALDFAVLPVWFLFFLSRGTRPDRRLPVPDLQVAMVVTKAPAEPWALVRRTLEAMLDQDYPYPYDVWLADERPDAATESWCDAHAVRISTRHGVDAYHRRTWPRRTRCKEGNLAYFYDRWGYDHYEVVSQLDADHVPEPDYLRCLVAPFADPRVGYVAAPSICDSNADRSWAARARLHAEAVLHGPVQAGSCGDYAPSCIGSHYAVRTIALRRVGGLGPELAEDFSTTLMLSADGWQGAFAIDAEAHGAGPETVADCMTQELQWARSMTTIALGIAPRYWRGLRWPAKVRLGFCELWYPLFGLSMLSSVVLPIIAVTTNWAIVSVPLESFLPRLLVPVGVLTMVTFWMRARGWLRPRDAPVLSWEAILFQFARWPWALFGCAQGLVGWLRGREFEFAVTPKGSARSRSLPTRVIAPYLALSAISGLGAVLDHGPAVNGYSLLALINSGVYAVVGAAIVALRARENGFDLAPTRALVPALATAAAAVVVAGCAVLHGAAGTGPTNARILTVADVRGGHPGSLVSLEDAGSPWRPPWPGHPARGASVNLGVTPMPWPRTRPGRGSRTISSRSTPSSGTRPSTPAS